jgi:hypothetical protein
MKSFLTLFSFSPNFTPVKVGVPKYRFHIDAASVTHVGLLRVDSPTYGLKDHVIAFGMEGVSKPPEMTLERLETIYVEAAKQGFTVHALVAYGSSIDQQGV